MSTPAISGGSVRALRYGADQATATLLSNREPGIGTARRVRDQARDAAVLMGFSAAVSVGLAVALVLVTSLGN